MTALAQATGVVEVAPEGADVDERGERPLVLSGPRCYLRRYALLEQRVVADRLLAAHALGLPDGAESALAAHGAHADEEQRTAVRRALAAPVSIVAGGPGTGKTTAVALLLAVAAALVPAALGRAGRPDGQGGVAPRPGGPRGRGLERRVGVGGGAAGDDAAPAARHRP